jgi:hypothetical protein
MQLSGQGLSSSNRLHTIKQTHSTWLASLRDELHQPLQVVLLLSRCCCLC